MRTLLIANRGEIACRIIRTAKQRGLRTVAVYSEADAAARHVRQADLAVCIGPAKAADSYLDIDRILAAARTAGADAIHPGYGFLSENPTLVDACEAAGIIFVGPGRDAMQAMGLKDAAKRVMADAGVPVVPGYAGESQEPGRLAQEAQALGYPVLIKARAGGGGKGMRRVESPAEFSAALASAKREAAAGFGDDHVLIEKYIASPRHIEVQVFGDAHGNVVHLFERDCTLQRRHQKVIEEAPAPGMNDAVRAAMTEAAIRAARAINYRGAGTVEFIVDGSRGLREDGFWFMEMNTRLQVEHPVTEAITGVDLVDWQLRVAAGEPLPLEQSEIRRLGHAVEARLYAERPDNGFLPATGRLLRFRPACHGRIDSGVAEGDEVLPYYDPLLAKLIAWADDRSSAFRKLAGQLSDTELLGTHTNREFLGQLVGHEQVLGGQFDTSFIDTHLSELLGGRLRMAMLAVAAVELVAPFPVPAGSSPGRSLGIWQLWGCPERHVRLLVEGVPCDLRLQAVKRHGTAASDTVTPVDAWHVSCAELDGFPEAGIEICRPAADRVRVDTVEMPVATVAGPTDLWVQLGAETTCFGLPVAESGLGAGPVDDAIISPMPGRIVALNCAAGDTVTAGDALVVIEAMKMEQTLCCSRDGVIEAIVVRVDEQVAQGMELLRLAPPTD